MTTITQTTGTTAGLTPLWKGAGLTAFAALLFPRVNAVIYDDERIWHLDSEARVLAPLVVLLSLAIFAAIGTAAWRGPRSRAALVAMVTGVVGVLGILAFWISAPIMFGGLAVTLGVEGLRRSADAGRRRHAVAGIVLGLFAMLAGAVLWLAGA